MNALNSFDKTDWEYSLAPTDNLIRFRRSKVKVTADRQCDDGIHVDAVVSKFLGRL